MQPEPQAGPAKPEGLLPHVFPCAFGLFLGLCLLKFGNPPITEKYVLSPSGFWEFLIGYPWPIAWAYGLLVLVSVSGMLIARWQSTAPRWLVALPLVWLVWQFVATAHSVDASLTAYTAKHLAACVLCFYLGYFSLSRLGRMHLFWPGLFLGFMIVVAVGWEQQLGGLKESRLYFFTYVYPQMKEVAPEFIKKISSDRIFSTQFYPNSLAGVLLLLLPVTLTAISRLRRSLTPAARWFLIGLVATASLACLYWSGSKGGWLLMMLLGLIALLRLPFQRRLKIMLVSVILVFGLAGFFWRYATFFKKGATSVSARFDYWRAALDTAKNHPLLGTGPGTFALAYEKIKKPESEMARLVHNDYLEQASDSGWVGCLLYSVFIVGALIWSYPRAGSAATADSGDWPAFAVWLGVLGWSLQSLAEFGLYLPALAWPAFTFLGCLLGRQIRSTTPGTIASLR
jgi:O-antigen ligase